MDSYKGTLRRVPRVKNPLGLPRTNYPRTLGFPANTNRSFGYAETPTNGTSGIRFGPYLFRRIFGLNVVAFILAPSPAGLGSEYSGDTFQGGAPPQVTTDLGLEGFSFVPFEMGDTRIYMPSEFSHYEPAYRRGDFTTPLVQPAFIGPQTSGVLHINDVLRPVRYFNRGMSAIAAQIHQMTVSDSVQLQQRALATFNQPAPIYQSFVPLNTYGGGQPYATDFWNYEVVSRYWNGSYYVEQWGVVPDTSSYMAALSAWHSARNQALAADAARHEAEQRAIQESYDRQLAEYEEYVFEVKSSNTAWEFVISKQRLSVGNNFAKTRRLADNKVKGRNGYAAFLGMVNSTFGHEVFDVVDAFVSNLFLDENYWKRHPYQNAAPRGYHVERLSDGQIIYRPDSWRIAFREFRSGNLQLNFEGFARDVVYDQMIDRFIGTLMRGQSDFAVLTDRPVGFTAGPAI